MAEITPAYIQKVCELFLPAYNQDHASKFELGEIPIESYADFFIHDGKTKIPIQYTQAMEEAADDIVKPRLADLFQARLREALVRRGLSGLFLSLSLRALTGRLEDLAEKVADFVEAQVGQVPAFFRLDEKRDLDELGLQEILRNVPSIEIIPFKGGGLGFGIDCADVPTTPHLNDQQVIEKAIEVKTKNYGGGLSGVVLLVDAVARPFWNFHLEKARHDRHGQTSGFKEIWAISLLGAEPFTKRIA